jgi:hypothetical protein
MASRAMGYSDYYKDNSNTPGSSVGNPNGALTDEADASSGNTGSGNMVAARKAALKRRLAAKKVGS